MSSSVRFENNSCPVLSVLKMIYVKFAEYCKNSENPGEAMILGTRLVSVGHPFGVRRAPVWCPRGVRRAPRPPKPLKTLGETMVLSVRLIFRSVSVRRQFGVRSASVR